MIKPIKIVIKEKVLQFLYIIYTNITTVGKSINLKTIRIEPKLFLASGVAEQRLLVQQNHSQPKLDICSHGRAFHQQWYERKIGCVELK